VKGIAKIFFELEESKLPDGSIDKKMVPIHPQNATPATRFAFLRYPVKRGFPIGVFVTPPRSHRAKLSIRPSPIILSHLPYGCEGIDPNSILLKPINLMGKIDALRKAGKLGGQYAFYPDSSLLAFDRMLEVAEDYWRYFRNADDPPSLLRTPISSYEKRKKISVDRRGHAWEKDSIRDLAICFFYPVWAQQERSLEECHLVLRELGIDCISKPDDIRRYIRRLRLPSLRKGRREYLAK
jgi:hypothetical protein